MSSPPSGPVLRPPLSLPLELLAGIIEEALLILPTDAHRTALCKRLCLVSRTFYRLAFPLLYHHVELNDEKAVFNFCRAARINGAVWTSVRAIFYGLALWGALPPFDGRLPPEISPQLEEAAWYAQTEMGGLLVGHAWSSRPVGPWCEGLVSRPAGPRADDEESELSREIRLLRMEEAGVKPSPEGAETRPPRSDEVARAVWAYHLCAPTLEHWAHRRFAALRSLTHLTLSIYPALVLDDDLLESNLRRILSTNKNLRHLRILVGHDSMATGSRSRCVNRSLTVARAVERVGDERIRVEGAPVSFSAIGQELGRDVVRYMLEGWRERSKGGRGPWPDPMTPHDEPAQDRQAPYVNGYRAGVSDPDRGVEWD